MGLIVLPIKVLTPPAVEPCQGQVWECQAAVVYIAQGCHGGLILSRILASEDFGKKGGSSTWRATVSATKKVKNRFQTQEIDTALAARCKMAVCIAFSASVTRLHQLSLIMSEHLYRCWLRRPDASVWALSWAT